MSRVLLLDLDHTLYPSTEPTLPAVDARITLYIEQRLELSNAGADALRREFCARYGTTLRGLELLHGVDRGEYTDFIQDLGDALMPGPNPPLRSWLKAAARRVPIYLFTNARRDWADRCLAALGLDDLFAETPGRQPVLRGVLDIDFMDWIGKPDAGAFRKVARFLTENQPLHAGKLFADDRLDNLEAARMQGWETVWVKPHDAPVEAGKAHRIVDSLLEIDPETL